HWSSATHARRTSMGKTSQDRFLNRWTACSRESRMRHLVFVGASALTLAAACSGPSDADVQTASEASRRRWCTPTTCAGQGASCGAIPNGCGGTLACGACPSPTICGGGGTPNVCGSADLPSIRVNAGGGAGVDAQGNAWSADSGFVGGATVDRGPIAISGT